MEKKFNVSGMMCVHCKKNVEESLKMLSGVSSAVADIDDKSVTVVFDDSAVTPQQMKDAVESAGSYEMTV